MAAPHALMLPFPAQGHITPLLELSFCLISRGFKVTFVNTEYNQRRATAAMAHGAYADPSISDNLHMVAIPDGLQADANRSNFRTITEGILKVMPGCLENLIEETNRLENRKVFTCFIADILMVWALRVGKKMGLRTAVFCPSAACLLSLTLTLKQQHIEEDQGGDENGQTKRSRGANSVQHYWNFFDKDTRKVLFQHMSNNGEAAAAEEANNIIICNSFHELEEATFENDPRILAVGPVHIGHRFSRVPTGALWSEDRSCVSWLDTKPANSVVYVAFGSLAVFKKRQFEEMANGLERMGRPFLWVVRPDNDFGLWFKSSRGCVVSWCPQQEVLQHPSIACFISHCGWNSTVEGIANGVPFLCWPVLGDQFYDQALIVDVLKIGLRLVDTDRRGIVAGEEICAKVGELLGDRSFKTRALALKMLARRNAEKGGSSYQNLDWFANEMKGGEAALGHWSKISRL